MNLQWEVCKSRGAWLCRHWDKQADCGLTAELAVHRSTGGNLHRRLLIISGRDVFVCGRLRLFINVNLNGEREGESRAWLSLSRQSRMICDIFCFRFHILNRVLLYFFFQWGLGLVV